MAETGDSPPPPVDGVIPTAALADDRDVTVARPALGLVLYLDQPLVWARQAARAVLLGFLERVNAPELKLFTTSVRPGYHAVTGNDMAKLLHDLPLPAARVTVRHLLWLRVVDNPHAARLAFSYREIDSDNQRRCGFVELIFPADLDPRVLADFAANIADQWPLLAGVGGYLVSWNQRERATAHDAAFPFCKRFLGLDLQDPDQNAWQLPRGLPGTGWLTLVGRGHAEALGIDLGELERRQWETPVAVTPLKHAAIIRAGAAPTLGDLNRLAYPSAYAEVARVLAPHFIEDPTPFMGARWSAEPDLTARWMRRLIDPQGWR